MSDQASQDETDSAEPLPWFSRPAVQWAAAVVFFAIVTVVYLWPVVKLNEFATMTQTRDALLISVIMDHTSRALFSADVELANLPIFYPLDGALFLSEPMLMPAVVLAPVIRLFGYTAGLNAFIYLCWFTLALAVWWYLRARGVGMLPALWAGFFIAFSPDRFWHSLGHAHLFYQTSFALVLIAVERGFHPGASRWWGVLFGAAFLLQVTAGFYITVIFAVFGAFAIPAAAWFGADGKGDRLLAGLKRQGPLMAAGVIAAGLAVGPLALQYSAFGENFPHNPLSAVNGGSGNLSGYLLPPHEEVHQLTPVGALVRSFSGPEGLKENTQYIGVIGMLVVPALLLMAGRRLARRRSLRLSPGEVWAAGLALAGLTALVLSFGPFPGTGVPERWTRLPFAWIYAWFEPIRFFRAPARFAFVVQWVLGLLGAAVLWRAMTALRARGLRIQATALGVAMLIVTMADFFPLGKPYRISTAQDGLVEWLSQRENQEPFLELPVDQNAFMARLGWHHVPVVNGFSGYAPENRMQNLWFAGVAMPSPEALAFLRGTGADRVFLNAFLEAERADAIRESGMFRELRSGPEGTMLELKETPPDFEDLRGAALDERDYSFDILPSPVSLIRNNDPDWQAEQTGLVVIPWQMEREPDGSWRTLTPDSSFRLEFRRGQPLPALRPILRMRIRIDNWYTMNERGLLYWATRERPRFDMLHHAEFMIRADGEFHEVTVDLSEHAAWMADDPVMALRFHPGSRRGNRFTIEWMTLTAEVRG